MGDSPSWQLAGTIALSLATMSHFNGYSWGFAEGSSQAAGMSAAASNLTVTVASTGKITGKDLTSSAFAALSAGVAHTLAHGSNGKKLGTAGAQDGSENWAKLVKYHALSQGIISALRGDSFLEGAVSALVSKGIGGQTGALFKSGFVRSAIVATAGGAVSKATGGDFYQGAMTAAVVFFYNEVGGGQKGGVGGYKCSSCVATKINGEYQWIPGDMVVDVIMAQETGVSVGEYTHTSTEEYAKGLGYAGFAAGSVACGAGSCALATKIGVWSLGALTAYLVPTGPNVAIALLGPVGHGAGMLYKPLGQVVENADYIRFGAELLMDIHPREQEFK